MADIDSYSYPVLKVDVLSPTGEPRAGATGILIKAAGKHFLATNYHVVSGKDPFTGESIDSGGVYPGKIRIHTRIPNGDQQTWSTEPIDVAVIDDSHADKWIELPERSVKHPGDNIELGLDVVLVELPSGRPYHHPLEWWGNTSFHLAPLEEVGIIGYPFAFTGTGEFPIWLRGSIASDLAGLPARKFFYVDARTRPSMSGSAVVHREQGPSFQKPGGSFSADGRSKIHFIGIYSGRLRPRKEKKCEVTMDVGIVWHWSIIEELLERVIPKVQRDWK